MVSYKSILYSKEMSPLEFNFETLTAPSMYNWMTYDAIYSLYNIATSVKYSSNMEKKKQAIKDIMTRCGCHKIGGGTNRVVYAPYECNANCFKISLDSTGIKANQSEYVNQNHIKPFITKMFEVDQCGVIGNYERVKAIQSRQEYESVAGDIYELIVHNILGKYIMEDIGNEYMFNYGVRPGFGVVLLDYAMLFELDGSKLFCCNNINGQTCDGEIDYDVGFNHLYCKKCGLHYQARKLASSIMNHKVKILKEECDMNLISQLVVNGKVVSESDNSTETIVDPMESTLKKKRVRMTPKEVRVYENEKRREENQRKRKEQEENNCGVLEDNRNQSIGDVVGEAIKELVKEDKNEVPKSYPKENIKQDKKEEPIIKLDLSKIQEGIVSGNDEEPDYSKYGLENVEEDNQNNKVDPKTESTNNTSPLKNKLKNNKNLDNL